MCQGTRYSYSCMYSNIARTSTTDPKLEVAVGTRFATSLNRLAPQMTNPGIKVFR